jgi:rhamnosyl/mannosyltransferase
VKRVLHLGKFFPPVTGGMERVLQTLCQVSAGLVESHVLVTHTGRDTVREDVTIAGLDGYPSAAVHVTRVGTLGAVGSVHVAPGFASELRRAEADLIILHEPNPWALLSYAIARPDVPLAIWYHSDVVRPALQYALFYAPMAKITYGRAARIVVSSPTLGAHAQALRPYRDRVRVIPFGIDPGEWSMAASEHERAAPFVLFAGRHVPYKGVDVLLRALATLAIPAVIVGDGPSRAGWEALARDLGVMDRVRFEGEVSSSRLRALMHACSIFVLPSVTRAEAFGYVQLEAMACGKPVVSTDVPSGVSWVNQHDCTGLVVPAGDEGALAHALSMLMAGPELRARMGEAGKQRVEREFTLTMLRQRMADLYEDLSVLEAERAAC